MSDLFSALFPPFDKQTFSRLSFLERSAKHTTRILKQEHNKLDDFAKQCYAKGEKWEEDFIFGNEERVNKEIKEFEKDIGWDFQELLLWLEESAFNELDDFGATLWEIQFVQCYALFEHQLNSCCKQITLVANFEPNFNDFKKQLRDKGIYLAKKYLRNVAKIPVPDQSSKWRDIKNYGIIRNGLLHNGGVLKKDKDILRIRKWRDGILDDRNKLIVSGKLVYETIETIKVFFEKLFEEMDEHLLVSHRWLKYKSENN